MSKIKRAIMALVVAVAIAVFGTVSVKHVEEPARPQDAATYCAPYVNYACWLHYQNCGPYQWNRWIGAWIDRCGGVLG